MAARTRSVSQHHITPDHDLCGLAGLVLLLALGPGLATVRATISPEDCARPANTIVAENCKPGNSSRDWDVNADGDPSIQVRGPGRGW